MKTKIKLLDTINQQMYNDAIIEVVDELYGVEKNPQFVANIGLLDMPLPYIEYEKWGKKIKE